ncbi:ACT domain-containing protein [Dietzia sp.]|uniref:ACT domain-containing protein n=1 Tax=Dietzia sp. TaxID=1871616 RepID=UPI002FDA509E
MSYLLRVTIPDRPGALGGLAVALGSVDANIVSLDVVESYDGAAIDDIVVDVPAGALPDTLITAAESLDGVSVVSLRPFDGRIGAHQELQLIDTVSSSGPAALDVIASDLPGVLGVSWALVLENDSAAGTSRLVAGGASAPADVDHLNIEIPTAERAIELDPATEGLPDSWTVMDTSLATARLGGSLALLVGRIGGPDFRPAELARFGYFAGIVSSVLPASAVRS